MPCQKLGRLKPSIEPVTIDPVGRPVRPEPGPQPQRHADADRDQHRDEGKLESGRQPRQDEGDRWLVVDERAAEIAVQRIGEEGQVLLVERPIETQHADGALALLGGGIRIDQQQCGIADPVEADEHDGGHRQYDGGPLQDAAYHEREHVAQAPRPSPSPKPLAGGICLPAAPGRHYSARPRQARGIAPGWSATVRPWAVPRERRADLRIAVRARGELERRVQATPAIDCGAAQVVEKIGSGTRT